MIMSVQFDSVNYHIKGAITLTLSPSASLHWMLHIMLYAECRILNVMLSVVV
jgi:hypothetical protein